MDSSPSAFQGKRGPLAAGVLALAFALLLTGCYTLLRHPSSQEYSSVSAGGQSCAQCHAESDEAIVEYAPWVDYYAHSSWPWINYYGSPWWQDDAWVLGSEDIGRADGDAGSGSGKDSGEPSGRQAWVRRPRSNGFSSIDSTRFRNPLVVPAPLISAPPSPGPAVGSSQGQQGSSTDTSGTKGETKEKKEEPRKRSIRR
ncbi:MAG: hypothetical protein KBD56_01905 [Candidatus Eisenbacteria bacterium]|nr:hypothetical protein [Candidatus Eisenbacteria bacterium]